MNLKRLLGQRMFDALGRWVISRALRTPHTHLRQKDDSAYMDRFWLFRIGPFRGAQYPLLAARVHHIQSSDDDRAFHDHPWPFLTIIFRGGYTEITPAEWPFDSERGHCTCAQVGGIGQYVRKVRYEAGTVLFRRARHWHMLHLDPGESAVTLFFTLPKVQGWGFLHRGEKYGHKVFDQARGGSGVYVAPTPGGVLEP